MSGLWRIAAIGALLCLLLPGCTTQQKSVATGASLDRILRSQILDPGPPSDEPVRGLDGVLAMQAVREHRAGLSRDGFGDSGIGERGYGRGGSIWRSSMDGPVSGSDSSPWPESYSSHWPSSLGSDWWLPQTSGTGSTPTKAGGTTGATTGGPASPTSSATGGKPNPWAGAGS